jgi:prepilin-type N-terminal cleavage/methylation domain-containing protein
MRTLGPRRGASLVELLVALVLFGIVGAATLRSLDRQARFHGGILAIMEARAQHAAAHEAMAVELRGASTAAGDVTMLTDSSVAFRLPVGTGVACDIATGVIDFAPDTVAAGQAFARFRTAPQAGDTAWVFDEGARDILADDRWVGLAVTSVSRSGGSCPASPLRHPVLDAALASWRFTFAGIAPATLRPGSTVRMTRPARFALYRSGAESWLGFAERNPSTGAWVTIQPVSGPYLPYNTIAPFTSGIALAGRDSSGAPTNLSPAAIALSTRTLTTRVVRMDGVARGRYADSLHSLIGMRNSR